MRALSPHKHNRYAGFTPAPIARRNTDARNAACDLVRGFTMVEIVVMLGIITMVSAVVLINFTGLNEGAALDRAAQELAVTIRSAQNDSLSVRQYDPSNPPPQAVGVRISEISSESTSFFMFADTVRDNVYTPNASEKIGSDILFTRGIRISNIVDQNGQNQSVVHIMFAAPEATVTLADARGASIGGLVEITIQTPSGQTKKVTVRASGQVSIQ